MYNLYEYYIILYLGKFNFLIVYMKFVFFKLQFLS